MKLYEASGKNVRITMTDGEVYEGFACDYTSALDNEPKPEAICIEFKEIGIELYAHEIKKIELLD